VYNIGGGSRVSINQVLEIIGRLSGGAIDARHERAQQGDMRDTYADTSLARREIGFVPSVTLEQGLAYEMEWLKQTMSISGSGTTQNRRAEL
jgi:nucleoside-diphosphate-sugar epimerase